MKNNNNAITSLEQFSDALFNWFKKKMSKKQC